MGLSTDDGFIIESVDGADQGTVDRWIVLAIDEREALDLLRHDEPEARHTIVDCGDDVRAQAARLGVEPGTYRQI